jgi:hypothetical protein
MFPYYSRQTVLDFSTKLTVWFNEAMDHGLNNGGLSVRYCAQTLGTEFGRKMDSNVWINHTKRVVGHIGLGGFGYDRTRGPVFMPKAQAPKFVPVSDQRFLNEIEAYRAAKGLVIRVVRPDTQLRDWALRAGNGNHKSETELATIPDSAYNSVIVNDGTIEDLYKKVDDTLSACSLA